MRSSADCPSTARGRVSPSRTDPRQTAYGSCLRHDAGKTDAKTHGAEASWGDGLIAPLGQVAHHVSTSFATICCNGPTQIGCCSDVIAGTTTTRRRRSVSLDEYGILDFISGGWWLLHPVRLSRTVRFSGAWSGRPGAFVTRDVVSQLNTRP